MFFFTLPEVDDNLLCFVDIERQIIVATPVHQILHLIPVLSLFEIQPTMVVSSANLKIELERNLTAQSWVYKDQETENTVLWGTSVKDYCCRGIVAYPY